MSFAPPPESELVSWNRLRPGWRALPRGERQALLRAAADGLHDTWSSGARLSALSLSHLAFERTGGTVTARLSGTARPPGRKSSPPHDLLNTMAAWNVQVRDALSPRDALHFLRRFMRHERMDPAAMRHAILTVAAMTESQVRRRAASLYRASLEEEHPDGHETPGVLRCEWHPDTSVDARALFAAIERIERAPETRTLKSNPIIRVMRANLLGHDALIKRYDLPRRIDRLKYRFRASRARRAWAAARTMLGLGIPTPEPLGFLEIYKGGVAARSYVFTEFMADAVSTYRWIKANYHRRPADWRVQFRRDLLACLLALYDRGIYHADTKTPNLLMTHPDDAARRTFYWIDLECVIAGVTPGRHEIVRNLVQLNGSFRHWVPEEDRIAFLRDIARRYPWLDRPRIVNKIRRWTLKRWRNEVSKHIGP
ncbi:MAG: lipopolysaccharide kinase InaA family protein [bacterium]